MQAWDSYYLIISQGRRCTSCCRHAGVAQLVRAPPCHGGGCGFKSRLSRIVFKSYTYGMDNTQFIEVSLGLLIILVGIVVYLFTKHKYNSRDVAAQLVRSETMSYDPSDPTFKEVSHKKAMIGFISALVLIIADVLGFFNTLPQANYLRGSYIVIGLLSLWVLYSDYKDKKR
jgi:hypothetical protein